MENERNSSRLHLDLPWKTILKILLAVLLAFVAIRLWPLLKLLALAALIAVTLYRMVAWSCERGWPRWVGLLLAIATLLIVVVGFFGLLGPMVVHEASTLGKELPKVKQQVLAALPHSGPLSHALQSGLNSSTGASPQQLLEKGLATAKGALGGLLDFGLLLVFAIYFMVDGPRALKWFVAFFPQEHRLRVAAGLAEIGDRIEAYVAGQFITSLLFAGFSFGVLTLMQVPMALLLAVLAGVFDVLPMIGIILAVLPAALLALTVSTHTALIVLACYLGYHLLEDYFIIPKVYGKKLKLSTLAVLLAFTVGGMLAGVIGAIVILPLVAAYPALERLWLSRTLEPEVIQDHSKLHAA